MTRDQFAFEDILEEAEQLGPLSMAVTHPCSEESLLGAVQAAQHGIITPILVAPLVKLQKTAAEFGVDLSPYRIIDVPHSHAAAEVSVELVNKGEAFALMKGSLHTDEFMTEVLKKQGGLRTERRLSHVFIMRVESYPRYLFITDAAINIHPDLAVKRDITQNAIDLAHLLGIAHPKVAILSAVETVNPNIQSTLDAAALCKMADRGQIRNGLVEGPLAMDNAVDLGAARTKGLKGRVAGRANILVVPGLDAGNMLAKQLAYISHAEGAGLVLGAKVPVILNSRSDSPMSRLASCAVAAIHHFANQTTTPSRP